MIELTFSTALVIYLCLTLFLLLGLWLFHHYHASKRKIITCDQKLYVCEYCHFAYLQESHKNLTRCPQCKSLNKAL